MTFQADMSEVEDLARSLRKAKEAAEDLKAINQEAAQVVERRIVPFVPVLTGRLKRSLRSAGQKRTGVIRAGYNGSRVPHAGVQNYGSPKRNIKGQRFMQKGEKKARPEYLAVYDKGLKKLVETHLP